MKETKIDFVLDTSYEEGDMFYFSAKSITKEFVCEAGLNRLANNSIGKPLVWRHEHPADARFSENHIYGEVVKSSAVDGYIVSTYGVYGHTKEHLKLREIIKKRAEIHEPLSISMRFRTYFNENKQPIHYDVIEHSATPTPACEECVVIDILNEVGKMPEEDKIKKEIEKMETELTKKDKMLENLQGEVEALKSLINTKDEALEKKDKEVEEAKTSSEKVLEQLVTFKDKLQEQSKAMEDLKLENKMAKVSPYLEAAIKADGEEMKEIYLEIAKTKPFEESKKFFEKRLEKADKDLPIMFTKTIVDSANENQGDFEELSLEKEKEMAKKAFKHNPELYKKLYGEK